MAKIFWIHKFITSFVRLVTELDLLVQELSAAQQKWEDIGRELDVEQDTLRDIRTKYSDPGDSLRMMLREKLERHCITWKYIVTILRTPHVGESNLAYQLETKYCLSEHLLRIIIMHYIIALKILFRLLTRGCANATSSR